ncbi:hypothetical protein HC891_07305, partial [Candidatus Gracilibacteria bacterium]|nr:hypothetical protein [Candidatus Gracilibacteria bacterium]
MLRTSILAQLTSPVCDALLEQRTSRAMLQKLEQANLVLADTGAAAGVCSYQAPFGDLLWQLLAQHHGEDLKLLRERANAWQAATASTARNAQNNKATPLVLRDAATVTETEVAFVEPLSGRELEVLSLIAEGASNKIIAERLYLAMSTVKNYVSTIIAKLDAHNRTHAVVLAR